MSTGVKLCIHGIDPRDCWCTVRYGEHGLINGQRVTFRGEKILTFVARRDTILPVTPPSPPFQMWGPTPAFDGRRR